VCFNMWQQGSVDHRVARLHFKPQVQRGHAVSRQHVCLHARFTQ
jgi:hypothetical protein